MSMQTVGQAVNCNVITKVYDIVGPSNGIIAGGAGRESIDWIVDTPGGSAVIGGLEFGAGHKSFGVVGRVGDDDISYQIPAGVIVRFAETGCFKPVFFLFNNDRYVEVLRVLPGGIGEDYVTDNADALWVQPSGAVSTDFVFTVSEDGWHRLYAREGTFIGFDGRNENISAIDIVDSVDGLNLIFVQGNPDITTVIDVGSDQLPESLLTIKADITSIVLTGNMDDNAHLVRVECPSTPSDFMMTLTGNTLISRLLVSNTGCVITGNISADMTRTTLSVSGTESVITGDLSLNTTLQILETENTNSPLTASGPTSPALVRLVLDNDTYSVIDEDQILVALDQGGASNGYVSMTGAANQAPGATGATAAANLVSRGWTVITN